MIVFSTFDGHMSQIFALRMTVNKLQEKLMNIYKTNRDLEKANDMSTGIC